MGGNAEYGPLWFTAHLLVYSLGYVALRTLLAPGRAVTQPVAAPGHLGVLGFVLALGSATAALRPLYPIDEWVRLAANVPAEPGRVPQYLGLFVVGIVAGRGDWFRTFDSRVAVVWAALGVLAWVVGVSTLPQEALIDAHPLTAVWGLLEAIVGVGAILGLTVLFRRWCNAPGRWLGRLEGQTYGVYLIHIFVVIALQFAVLDLAWPALAKFAVVWAAALVVSFAVVAALRLIPPVRAVV
ncbi:MAG: acyltransferase family protein [Rhodobacter sp.]|nr:acyltransferase family protein [Rhodobacter sp.]